MKRIHYWSGLILTLFVGLHIYNHLYSLMGVDAHIALMHDLRHVYRHPVGEVVLIAAVGVQLYSGMRLWGRRRKSASGFFPKLQVWTGLYIAIFLLIHLSAIAFGRWVLHLDTNFYFGAAGLNHFPVNLFFVPYYALAIIAFFGHIAAVHSQKMSRHILGCTPVGQAYGILITGIILSLIVLYGLTDGFKGIVIPQAYEVMTGT